MFDFVCDRLGSPSDLDKSWGECDGRVRSTSGGGGVLGLRATVPYCTCSLCRALSSWRCGCRCIQMAGSLGINTAVDHNVVTLVCRRTEE